MRARSRESLAERAWRSEGKMPLPDNVIQHFLFRCRQVAQGVFRHFVLGFDTLLCRTFSRRRTTKCRNRFRGESALSPKLWAWQRLKNSGPTRTAVAVAWTTECQMRPSALSFLGAQVRGKQASPIEAIGEAARPQSRRTQCRRRCKTDPPPPLRCCTAGSRRSRLV